MIMAKIKNVYDDIVSDENIYKAYLNARKNKRYRKDVLIFTQNLEANLVKIQNELRSEVADYPKFREFYVY